ncbi:uncharacterized protein LOC115633700 [Scaptodrosophila lebanonensis]|uniref:Uncharacterized protein LOC115633700 n=1 Tax=Drosophila lebanonensis TaxID=7225 RepID=A0A6J2UF41_DROLE|nr:uncharacterized protein LOC115633700 [Scaptodrosophila lebanonensis]
MSENAEPIVESEDVDLEPSYSVIIVDAQLLKSVSLDVEDGPKPAIPAKQSSERKNKNASTISFGLMENTSKASGLLSINATDSLKPLSASAYSLQRKTRRTAINAISSTHLATIQNSLDKARQKAKDRKKHKGRSHTNLAKPMKSTEGLQPVSPSVISMHRTKRRTAIAKVGHSARMTWRATMAPGLSHRRVGTFSTSAINLAASKSASEQPSPLTLRKAKRRTADNAQERYSADESNESTSSKTPSSDSSELDDENELTERYIFLKTFKDLPRLSEMSDTLSADIRRLEAKRVELRKPDDMMGQFVDKLESTEAIQTPTIESVYEEGEAESEESVQLIESRSSEDTVVSMASFILEPQENEELFKPHVHVVEVNEEADVVERMTQLKVRTEVDFDDPIEVNKMRQHQQSIEACHQFLQGIINQVVQDCESYKKRLIRVLDKFKMQKRLRALVDQYIQQRQRHEQLTKLVTEYFLRKKRFACITEPKNQDKISESRYILALTELDRFLKHKKEMTLKHNELTQKLKEEVTAMHILVEHTVHNFESCVKSTLFEKRGDEFTLLKRVVDELLRRISHFGNEVANIRYCLLMKQHQFAAILNKLEKMEDIGNGLEMREYLTKLNEVQVLYKKIEERDAELKRYNSRINYDIHSMAHLRCKEQMVIKTTSRLKSRLESRMNLKTSLRRRIYEGKIQHNKILKETKKIKNEGCLMHYPALMRDYDENMAILIQKRSSVERLRNDHDRLTARIKQLEVQQISSIKIDKEKSADANLNLNEDNN